MYLGIRIYNETCLLNVIPLVQSQTEQLLNDTNSPYHYSSQVSLGKVKLGFLGLVW